MQTRKNRGLQNERYELPETAKRSKCRPGKIGVCRMNTWKSLQLPDVKNAGEGTTPAQADTQPLGPAHNP